MSKNISTSEHIVTLKQEIEWCHNNADSSLSEDYQKGFVKGLEQAIFLLKSFQDKVNDDPGVYSSKNTKHWVPDVL